MYNFFLVEKKELVATVTFNRPDKMNTLTPQMQKELMQVLDELDNDDDITVVILTGAGHAFCAGFDVDTVLGDFSAISTDDIPRIVNSRKIFIAAVNGHALAQGFQIATACDFIVASKKAVFGAIGVKINEVCTYCVCNLPAIVGRPKAFELLYTGELFDGGEAARIGLVTKVVPAEQLMTAANELADRIKYNAPAALRYTKQALRKGEYPKEHLDWMKEVFAKLTTMEDSQEAFKAFRMKRQPVFKGR